jgi:hypothetical protein
MKRSVVASWLLLIAVVILYVAYEKALWVGNPLI